ncbi:MAG: type III toxin-antitoxin system ToxN/AbiQ family toxin [Clostridia bacterium]|nr:type III toxin-antitoxin system ToxN/AbiQ family toxin [Clostridia bacterium]
MLKFYDIETNYINYLKTIDCQIPDITYLTNNKFVCGVVLDINGITYYAPVSHTTKKYRTNQLIYDKGQPISSIRFSFMFPAPQSVLTQKDFKQIRAVDPHYADIITAEYRYCAANEYSICQKAKSVYNIGCNKNHPMNYTCCDFKKLEALYLNYDKTITY